MSDFDSNFKNLRSNFTKVTKRVLNNRSISAKKSIEYEDALIKSYNQIIIQVNSYFENRDKPSSIIESLSKCREQLTKCFSRINCNIKIPKDLSELIQESESSSDFDTEEELSDASTTSAYKASIIKKSHVSFLEDFPGFSNSLHNNNLDTISEEQPTMATSEQKKTFITMCASIIRENYSGDPLSLASFIDKIVLIEDLMEENLTNTFISFIKSKLEGKAREAIPNEVTTIQQIKDALKGRIKPDNSKVVARKIASLKVFNNNHTEFAKRVEELSDALERSLVIEGMTQEKAHEMAVEQTVNVCRLNTRSDLVKSILASTTFTDSKDVVAKMIVEQNNQTSERQVLAFRSRYNRQNNSFRGNFRSNQYNRNNFSRYNNNFNRNNNSNYRHNNNNNYGSRSNGNFRNNNSRPVNRNNSNNNSNNNNRRSNTTNNASVRTLNANGPQERTLGDQNLN
ncbi:kinesin-related protein 10-like [Eurosta solidaginis]|uniref:kinesin-related protein 10-like n=1 Tax=Eurosta solidaginis TaxID=178769 RepID=UPI003530FDAC